MKLIVGLGNIGAHFDGSRHNIGFAAVDAIAETDWQLKDRFKAQLIDIHSHGDRVLYAKPTTYYNASGEAVRAIKDFYKLKNSDILIVHDELALPFGTIRIRTNGSDAGNNGVKSVIAHVGEDIARVRIGIANEHAATSDTSNFVLSHFSHAEMQQLPKILRTAKDIMNAFVANETFEPTSVRIEE